jgi:hypothetical protein
MSDPADDISAEERLDSTDEAILGQLDRVVNQLDPPPADLDDRVIFSIQLDDVDREVARLVEGALVGAEHRGTESTHTLAFEADSRAILLTVVEGADGLVRLDGWLAPAAPLRVELRFADSTPSRTVTCDAAGGFVFDAVPRGYAQLIVDPADEGGRSVVTPSFAV